MSDSPDNYIYVITGDELKAMVVHSNMLYPDFKDSIKSQTIKLHPKGNDTVWKWGIHEFVNPKVYF